MLGDSLCKKEKRQETAISKYLTGNAVSDFQKPTLRTITFYLERNPQHCVCLLCPHNSPFFLPLGQCHN